MKQAPWLLAPAASLEVGETVILDDVETRHASGPLRLTSGRRVVLADGAGTVAEGTLSLPRRGFAEVVIESLERRPAPQTGLTLAVGILAGPAMDLVVQKAVELGVLRLVPVSCERSQLGGRRAANRTDHWTRVGRQALKQCRRTWAMELAPPATLTDLVAEVGPDRGVVADPDGSSVERLSVAGDAVLLVGPEGGFASDERRAIEGACWPTLRLGPHVLRAETAAIAGVAVLLNRIACRSG